MTRHGLLHAARCLTLRISPLQTLFLSAQHHLLLLFLKHLIVHTPIPLLAASSLLSDIDAPTRLSIFAGPHILPPGSRPPTAPDPATQHTQRMTGVASKSGMSFAQRLPGLPGSARSQAAVLFTLALCTVTLLLFEYDHLPTRAAAWVPERLRPHPPLDPIAAYELPPSSVQNAGELREWCAAPDEYEQRFGRANLRRSRGYEGEFGKAPSH